MHRTSSISVVVGVAFVSLFALWMIGDGSGALSLQPPMDVVANGGGAPELSHIEGGGVLGEAQRTQSTPMRLIDSNTGAPIASTEILAHVSGPGGLEEESLIRSDNDGMVIIPLGTQSLSPADGFAFKPAELLLGRNGKEVHLDGQFRAQFVGGNYSDVYLAKERSERDWLLYMVDMEDSPKTADRLIVDRGGWVTRTTMDFEVAVVSKSSSITPGHPIWSGSVKQNTDGTHTATYPRRSDAARISSPFKPSAGESLKFYLKSLGNGAEIRFLASSDGSDCSVVALIARRKVGSTSGTMIREVQRHSLGVDGVDVVFESVIHGTYSVTSSIRNESILALSSQVLEVTSDNYILVESNGAGSYSVMLACERRGWTLVSLMSREPQSNSMFVPVSCELDDIEMITGLHHPNCELWLKSPTGDIESVTVDLTKTGRIDKLPGQ